MSQHLDKFYSNLQDAYNNKRIEFITITRFYKSLVHLTKRKGINAAKLGDICLLFAECITTFLGTHEGINDNDIVTLQKYLQIIGDVTKIKNLQPMYALKIAIPLLQMVIRPDTIKWFNKELLKNFKIVIGDSNEYLKNILVQENFYDFCKVIDELCVYGDYEYQMLLLETIIIMFSDELIRSHANDLFPESQFLKSAFCEINRNNLFYETRKFLNVVNSEFKNVLSFKCEYAIIDDDQILPPKNLVGEPELWVDFNTKSKSISIPCSKNSFAQNKLFEYEKDLEIIKIMFEDIKMVKMSKLMENESGDTNGSLILFKLKSERIILYSQNIAKDNLKLVVFDSSDVEILEKGVLPVLFGDKFEKFIPSQEGANDDFDESNKKEMVDVNIGSYQSNTVCSSKILNTVETSSVSDALSLKSKLRDFSLASYSLGQTYVSKQPHIKDIEELVTLKTLDKSLETNDKNAVSYEAALTDNNEDSTTVYNQHHENVSNKPEHGLLVLKNRLDHTPIKVLNTATNVDNNVENKDLLDSKITPQKKGSDENSCKRKNLTSNKLLINLRDEGCRTDSSTNNEKSNDLITLTSEGRLENESKLKPNIEEHDSDLKQSKNTCNRQLLEHEIDLPTIAIPTPKKLLKMLKFTKSNAKKRSYECGQVENPRRLKETIGQKRKLTNISQKLVLNCEDEEFDANENMNDIIEISDDDTDDGLIEKKLICATPKDEITLIPGMLVMENREISGVFEKKSLELNLASANKENMAPANSTKTNQCMKDISIENKFARYNKSNYRLHKISFWKKNDELGGDESNTTTSPLKETSDKSISRDNYTCSTLKNDFIEAFPECDLLPTPNKKSNVKKGSDECSQVENSSNLKEPIGEKRKTTLFGGLKVPNISQNLPLNCEDKELGANLYVSEKENLNGIIEISDDDTDDGLIEKNLMCATRKDEIPGTLVKENRKELGVLKKKSSELNLASADKENLTFLLNDLKLTHVNSTKTNQCMKDNKPNYRFDKISFCKKNDELGGDESNTSSPLKETSDKSISSDIYSYSTLAHVNETNDSNKCALVLENDLIKAFPKCDDVPQNALNNPPSTAGEISNNLNQNCIETVLPPQRICDTDNIEKSKFDDESITLNQDSTNSIARKSNIHVSEQNQLEPVLHVALDNGNIRKDSEVCFESQQSDLKTSTNFDKLKVGDNLELLLNDNASIQIDEQKNKNMNPKETELHSKADEFIVTPLDTHTKAPVKNENIILMEERKKRYPKKPVRNPRKRLQLKKENKKCNHNLSKMKTVKRVEEKDTKINNRTFNSGLGSLSFHSKSSTTRSGKKFKLYNPNNQIAFNNCSALEEHLLDGNKRTNQMLEQEIPRDSTKCLAHSSEALKTTDYVYNQATYCDSTDTGNIHMENRLIIKSKQLSSSLVTVNLEKEKSKTWENINSTRRSEPKLKTTVARRSKKLALNEICSNNGNTSSESKVLNRNTNDVKGKKWVASLELLCKQMKMSNEDIIKRQEKQKTLYTTILHKKKKTQYSKLEVYEKPSDFDDLLRVYLENLRKINKTIIGINTAMKFRCVEKVLLQHYYKMYNLMQESLSNIENRTFNENTLLGLLNNLKNAIGEYLDDK